MLNKSPCYCHLTFFEKICYRIHCLDQPILLCFLSEPSKILWNTLKIVKLFLSFKETTHAYLQKASRAHNKDLKPLFYLLINCILARSASQILSLIEEKTLRLWIFFWSSWFMKIICKLLAWHSTTASRFICARRGRFFIKKLVTIELIFFHLHHISYSFIRFCYFDQIFINIISHIVLETSFI